MTSPSPCESWQRKFRKQIYQRAFENIMEMLTSETTMAYFDPLKETNLTTDVSPVGLSVILSQTTSSKSDHRVDAYTSRSLSDVECHYLQTEKEALAIVWAVESFCLYMYGKHFTLLSDCKPIEMIFNNARSKPPAGIERWNLRLQGYGFQVVHNKLCQIHPITFHAIPGFIDPVVCMTVGRVMERYIGNTQSVIGSHSCFCSFFTSHPYILSKYLQNVFIY